MKRYVITATGLIAPVGLVVYVLAATRANHGLQAIGLFAFLLGGLLDLVLLFWTIPHVNNNPRLGETTRVMWIIWLVLFGFLATAVYCVHHVLTGHQAEPPDIPQPPDGVAAGWYPDPYGQGAWRWHDGYDWTPRVG